MYQIDGYWKVQLVCLIILVALFVALHFGWFGNNDEICYSSMRLTEATNVVLCQ